MKKLGWVMPGSAAIPDDARFLTYSEEQGRALYEMPIKETVSPNSVVGRLFKPAPKVLDQCPLCGSSAYTNIGIRSIDGDMNGVLSYSQCDMCSARFNERKVQDEMAR